jgi:hypothetical protein
VKRCPPGHAVRLIASAFAVAILTGCTDDPAAPVRSADSSLRFEGATDIAHPLVKHTPEPSFALEVEAVGSFKPGHPVHLTLSARANSDVHDGELRVTLPEVASAEDSNWDVVVMAVSEDFRPHIEVRQSFSAGDRIRERVTLNIPEPGYYHVAATGYRHSSEAEPGRLADVSRQDYWLWIAEHGGKLTTSFDTTLFSGDDRRQTGPRGSQRRPSRVRSKDANITCTIIPDDGTIILQSGCPGPGPIVEPEPPPSATATFRVIYTRSDRGISNRPVPDARYTWNVVSNSTGATVGAGAGQVGSDGGVGVIDCQGPTSDRRISFTVYTLNAKANVRWGGLGELAYSQTMACGGHTDVPLQPEMAHLFLSAVKIYDNHGPAFNTFADRIFVGLHDDGETYYHFNHPDKELHIARNANMIYGEYGVMVLTHEHGHHYQHTKLFISPERDGLMRFQKNCATVHPPQSDQNMGCAFGEAFADWYATVVRRSELPTWVSDLENNTFYRNCIDNQWVDGVRVTCNIDGSRIQGAIAAMLWDLSDTNWEHHDRLQIQPWQIAERIKTCRVRVGGNWYPYDGVDHLILCLEGRSPYQVTVTSAVTNTDVLLVLFGSRPQSQWPTAVTAGVILSNNDDFRLLWLTNLYSKVNHVGSYPQVKRSVEYEPQPIPPGDGGGGCGSLECPIIY